MAINLDVRGNTAPLEAEVRAAVNRIRKIPVKLSIDDKGATQPLGNMRRGADEFSKSMEAANARIIAFGASMAIINGVGNAFKALVRDVIEVEKSLADIFFLAQATFRCDLLEMHLDSHKPSVGNDQRMHHKVGR